eukprot:jgi/Psemu1/52373/gm1.52373_g
MLTPFDWTPIFGIEFRFASASNPTAAASLNKAYSEIIGIYELSEFFVTREADAKEDEGPLEIAPDPQLHILNCIAKAIAISLIDPPDAVTKRHIANLLSKCVIKHVTNNGVPTKRMRDTTEFDAAAKHAIQTNTDEEPTVLIELTITHWRFRPDWNASLFNKIYEDQSVIIPSSPATIPSDTSKDNVLPSSFRTLFTQAYTRDPPSNTAKLLPVQPAKANANVIVPSGTTGLVHTKTINSNNVKTSLNSTAPRASLYTWTWTYSPNSDSVSFHRVQSNTISLRRVASSRRSSVKRQEKSTVTALPVMPPTLPSSDHHSAPPYVPTNFRWTFNPQSETVTFHRLPKPASVPLKPSLQLPLSKAIHEGILTYAEHSADLSHLRCEIYSVQINVSSASPNDIAMP